MKKFAEKARKGFSLVELLIAVVVLGILGAMLIAAGTAAQTKARVSVASNDIDSVRNSVYTAFMMHPEVMQYTDKQSNFESIVNYINEELDENWQWEPIGGTYPTKSGPVAKTVVQLDPWKNPYIMYIYTDTHTTKYVDSNGADLTGPDSCVYVVIASAGPNGTGVGTGLNGTIGKNGAAISTTDIGLMVNNTDGIDDLGVVIRIKNGSTTMATFGWQSASLGELKNVNWYFCGEASDDVNGSWSELDDGHVVGMSDGPSKGSSVDRYPNLTEFSKYYSPSKSAPVKAGITIENVTGGDT